MSHENHSLAGVGQRSYVIFAIDAAFINSAREADLLQSIRTKPVQGGYTMESTGETVVEASYIIAAEDWTKVLASGLVDNQESILVLGPKASRDAHRPAVLHFLPKTWDVMTQALPVFLGYFVDCEEHVAKAQSGWTEDNGVFYACFHDPEDAQE
jgi:hypothetical protein